MEQTVNIILKELREFRTENNKRWEENDEKWKQNDRKLEKINQRLTKVENETKSLKKEVIRIFETTEEAVEKNLKDINNKLDITINTLNALSTQNNMEHKVFVDAINTHETKLNLQNVRIEKLEEWKEEFDSGECVPV